MIEVLAFSAVMAMTDVDLGAEIRGWATTILVFAAAIFGAVYAGRSARKNRREAQEDANRNPTPPTTAEVWARMDDMEENSKRMERLFEATLGILDEVVEALPEGYRPVRSRRHLAILQEAGYLPERLASTMGA